MWIEDSGRGQSLNSRLCLQSRQFSEKSQFFCHSTVTQNTVNLTARALQSLHFVYESLYTSLSVLPIVYFLFVCSLLPVASRRVPVAINAAALLCNSCRLHSTNFFSPLDRFTPKANPPPLTQKSHGRESKLHQKDGIYHQAQKVHKIETDGTTAAQEVRRTNRRQRSRVRE